MSKTVSPDILKKLFFGMLRIRMVEETIAERYAEQEMRCPVHLSIGQEAPAVGVCAWLTHDDYAFSTHRCHAHYLAKGGALKPMMAEIYGKATGCCKGKGGSMHLVDLAAGFLGAAPIVGSTIPIGVGAAFGSVMKGKKNVTAVFFGEGATEEGVFHESVNFAVLKNLPVVFVCENNLYSVYSPLSVRQSPKRDLAAIARANGLEAFEADGNNVAEVYTTAANAIERVRNAGAPVLLVYSTYRWREHCGPGFDNHIGYRTEEEFQQWKALCPIAALESQLLDLNLISTADIASMKTAIQEEIDEAFKFAKESPFPEQHTMMEEVFAQ